jgi:enoyl-[acyl-carrier-protein] reductase (NADH)
MPTGAADVCSQGETGSDRRAVKVALLTTHSAKLMTGETLYIDGGYHIID